MDPPKSPFDEFIANSDANLMAFILQFIDEKTDMLSLMSTSTTLQGPAKKRFADSFKILDLRPGHAQVAVQEKTNKFLQWLVNHPDNLLGSVVEFRIEVHSLKDCTESFCRCNPCTETIFLVASALIKMVKLKSLDLSCYLSQGIIWAMNTMQFAEDPRPLQHLTSLFYHGSQDDRDLSSLCLIKRVYATHAVANKSFRVDSDGIPPLSHLVICNFDPQHYQPSPFQNLQHFGTIPKAMLQSFLGIVKEAQPFLTITSIDISGGPNQALVTQADCIGIKLKITHLVKILVHEESSPEGPVYTVWEYVNLVWVSRLVRPFTTWEIINGNCDEM